MLVTFEIESDDVRKRGVVHSSGGVCSWSKFCFVMVVVRDGFQLSEDKQFCSVRGLISPGLKWNFSC